MASACGQAYKKINTFSHHAFDIEITNEMYVIFSKTLIFLEARSAEIIKTVTPLGNLMKIPPNVQNILQVELNSPDQRRPL